jgi:hypothetical protein
MIAANLFQIKSLRQEFAIIIKPNSGSGAEVLVVIENNNSLRIPTSLTRSPLRCFSVAVVSSISVPFAGETDDDNAEDDCTGMRKNSGRA